MENIPAPPGLPLVGNAYDVDSVHQTASLEDLAQKYGPLFEVRLMRDSYLVCSNFEIFDELCDEKRFTKHPAGGLWQLRHGLGDGLFTSQYGEHNWDVAHRILTPLFGALAMERMFDGMHSVASQLVLKWARHGPEHDINSTEDLTRLTLDTMALCSMSTRFNSFYRDEIHPFAQAMSKVLLEAGRRASRSDLMNSLMWRSSNEFFGNIEVMRTTCQTIIDERRSRPLEKDDLVSSMLSRKDPKTGEMMSDENVINNMITFLLAGHETTCGFLAFFLYEMIKHPLDMRKAQQEIDSVVGKGQIDRNHLKSLPFLTACLREAIRLHPPGAANFVITNPDSSDEFVSLGGGRYKIPKGTMVRNLIRLIQTDKAVYGIDAEEFRPERMLDEQFEKYPPNAWKPFGNGSRRCIGRDFAWQEATLVATALLQNFDFSFSDPSYKLQIQQTLTVKPKDMFLRAAPRIGLDALAIEKNFTFSEPAPTPSQNKHDGSKGKKEINDKKPMSVFYGSNTGTCESLARSICNPASHHGYQVNLRPLDEAVDNMPSNQPTLIVVSTYEGQPPDNATKFIEWIQRAPSSALSGVDFAVFGCGNRYWNDTFQRTPKLVDAQMERVGGKRLAQRGAADTAENNVFDDFEKWEDDCLWPSIQARFGLFGDDKPNFINRLDAVLSSTCGAAKLSAHGVQDFLVLNNRPATKGFNTNKRHIELQLPVDATYRAGDYLTVLPQNPPSIVERVMRRFGLPENGTVYIKSKDTFLPHETLLHIKEVLASFVELGQPATRRNLKILIHYTHNPATKMLLKSISGQYFASSVPRKRTTLLDILETYPGIIMPFQDYLALLPQLRPRHYTISSSPYAGSRTCTLTYSVLEAPSWTNRSKRFLGTATNYMASLQPGDYLQANVKRSAPAFHLLPPERFHVKGPAPIIMICAGSGIARFRGFIQERASIRSAQLSSASNKGSMGTDGRSYSGSHSFSNTEVTILYAGHRDADDRLYEDELREWSSQGVVDVRWVSRNPEEGTDHSNNKHSSERRANMALRRSYSEAEAQGKSFADTEVAIDGGAAMYVQDRLWADRKELRPLIDDQYPGGKESSGEAVGRDSDRVTARVFVCGSRSLVSGVEETLKKLRMDWEGGRCDVDRADKWLEAMKLEGRLVADAFD